MKGGNTVAVLAFVLPILPGKQEAWRRFCQELLGSHYREFEESQRRLGIIRKCTWFAQTMQGEMAIFCLEGEHPEHIFPCLAESELPFDSWLRQHFVDLHGFDVAKLPQGPTRELIFSWQESH
jgi:hypothetical protein